MFRELQAAHTLSTVYGPLCLIPEASNDKIMKNIRLRHALHWGWHRKLGQMWDLMPDVEKFPPLKLYIDSSI